MEDALRRFPADEVIISTHPPGRSNWLERDVVERARERFDIRSRTSSSTSSARAGPERRLLDGQVALHAGLLVARH